MSVGMEESRRARAAAASELPSALGHAPAATESSAAESASALLSLLQELSVWTEFAPAATTVCTQLATQCGAARVVLGWRRKGQAPTRPVALSGAGLPQWDAETIRGLVATLDEAVDQARVVVYPASEGGRVIVRAHETWCRRHGLAAAMTVPMAVQGQPVGAVLLEFLQPMPAAQVAELTRAIAWVTPWLHLLESRQPSWLARLWARRRRDTARWWVGGLAVVLLGLGLVPRPVTISAPARIEGAVQRSVVAPIRGYLKSVAVQPGDLVEENQVLAELGDRDLDLEHARLSSEVAQYAAAVRGAMARGDRPAMAVEQARHDEAAGRLALVEHQLEQIRVRAPMAGVVLEGDLTQRLGAPMDRGGSLFVLAPPQRYRVVIELDERDVARVHLYQTGRIGVSALPWESAALELTRIAPAATVQDGRHVFEVQARLTEELAGLRPGQRGTAYVQVGRAPWIVHALRHVSDALGRLWWRWRP